MNLHDKMPPLPEPSEMDGARWGYTTYDMHSYGIDCSVKQDALVAKLKTACNMALRELDEVLCSVNADKVHHDGDAFHEAINALTAALAAARGEVGE